ncbi:hypothetical protein CWI42_052000 [Ordospora colligata]|uniref:Uncharacterized protein n=1 Tax=Ordospora colligata OC4 TaxID=1354746 RepID=A0A0B2ULF9_9MICR|nr:uncharacterized protein M896_052050 [Ordospora colligata OC4]KHN69795.1 hypothetical protein M896_052050 [Ordospora colligata OC4]TBU15598.1 hypothetical protein CWI41_052040 [Ordospora colligata]TBU15665.1 hypothetical protein CWI40_052020 [Ordospora colligata]TBU18716.1 hypothetical protein CWI42_052000 [Ordospora colligata]
MSFLRKKSLANFGEFEDANEILGNDAEDWMCEENPSMLASICRRVGQKSKAIQALQKKSNQRINRNTYLLEILSTYVYFGDYEGAIQRGKLIDSRDEPIERLMTQIEIHQSTNEAKICCGTDESRILTDRIIQYLSKYFNVDVFELLKNILTKFCNNNVLCNDKNCGSKIIDMLVKQYNMEYLQMQTLDALKYLYHSIGILDALRVMVIRTPTIDEMYFDEFVQKCNPTNDEILSILERIYIPSVHNAIDNSLMTECALKVMNHTKKRSNREVKLNTSYSKKIPDSQQSKYIKIISQDKKHNK